VSRLGTGATRDDANRLNTFRLRPADSCDTVSWIAEDRDDAASLPVDVDERAAFDTLDTFPADGKTRVDFLDRDGRGIPLPS
jgi:uncharacterized protein (DUF1684 family)